MNVELLPTAVEEDKVATPQKPTVDDNADTYTIPDIEESCTRSTARCWPLVP